MQPSNPQYQERVREIFDKAAFINDLGIKIKNIGPGWCETIVDVHPQHLSRRQVLRHGKTISVAESEAFTIQGDQEKLVAKAMVSLTVMQNR